MQIQIKKIYYEQEISKKLNLNLCLDLNFRKESLFIFRENNAKGVGKIISTLIKIYIL